MTPIASSGIASAPRDEEQLSDSQGIWRDGNLLVLTRGVELPNICLKSNEPTKAVRICQQLTWTPTWILAVVGSILFIHLYFGLFLCLILSPIFTRRAKVKYPASPKVYRRWQLSRGIGWGTAAGFVAALLGVGVALSQNERPTAEFLLRFAVLVISVGFVAKYLVGWRLRAKRISQEYVWLKGVHPDYLKRLPQMPIQN
jgi:hypothetical protein